MVQTIAQDAASTVEFTPRDARPASATLTVYNPGGTSIGTPVVTVDNYAGTIGVVTSQTVVAVTDDTGTSALNRRYWWLGADGVEGLVRLSEDDGSDWTFEAAAPGTIVAADTLAGARLKATVTAAMAATRDRNYRLEWVVTGADSVVRRYRQVLDVVRTPFTDPMDPAEAARYVAGQFPTYGVDEDAGRWHELSRRVNARVRRLFRATERYPDLLGDPDALRETDAGIYALRLELAREGFVVPGHDPTTYEADQMAALQRAIGDAVSSCWYDVDDSGSVEDIEMGGAYSVLAVRQ